MLYVYKKLIGRPEDQCFHLMDSEMLIRGCILEDDNDIICSENDEKCKRCKTNGCNAKAFNAVKCVSCESSDPKCKEGTEDLVTTCISSDVNLPACYFWEEGIGVDSKVKRGCVDSLETEGEKKKCLENKNECRSCYTDKCNVKGEVL